MYTDTDSGLYTNRLVEVDAGVVTLDNDVGAYLPSLYTSSIYMIDYKHRDVITHLWYMVRYTS